MNTEERYRELADRDQRPFSRHLLTSIGGSVLALTGLFLTAAGAMAQNEVVKLLSEDVQRGSLVARSIGDPLGTPALDVESAAITVRLPSREPYPAYLITAYEPASGLFWWTFQGAGPGDPDDRIANPPADLAFFVSDREIVGVELGTAPPALWIQHSTTRVDSFARGRDAALVEIARSAQRIEQGTARWMRSVSLSKALPRDFYYQPDHPMPKLELKVTSFERSGDDWVVTLEGRAGRMAEVRLDDLFVLESAREMEARPGN